MFIRAKYIQHAFVHPHPNFERPEVPLPRPTFPQLLNPSSRSPQQKRSFSMQVKRPFSPQLKIRSPKQKLARPASFAAGFDRAESGKSCDSDDESTGLLHNETIDEVIGKKETRRDTVCDDRPASAAGGGMSSSTIAQLTENFKKLEKSGKLKSWGGKIKAGASRNLGRFSKSQSALYKSFSKLRRDSPKASPKASPKTQRKQLEVHSDNDSDALWASSSTPLLLSTTASSATPPPKPPRTFKTRLFDIGPPMIECPQSPSPHPPSPQCDDFSGNVLSAIGEMGRIYSQTEETGEVAESSEKVERIEETNPAVVANGRVTMGVLAPDTAVSTDSLKTLLASPNHSQVQFQAEKTESETPTENFEDLSSSGPAESKSDAAGDRVVTFTVTVATPPGSLEGSTRVSMDELSRDEDEWSEALTDTCTRDADPDQERRGEDDADAETPLILRKQMQWREPPCDDDEFGDPGTYSALPLPGGSRGNKDLDKRMSIMSVASTEWFSASSSSDSESLDDFVSSPSQVELEEGIEVTARTPSSTSEVYNTPPSTPPPFDIDRYYSTPEPTNQEGDDGDHVTDGLRETGGREEPESRTEEADRVSDIAVRESGDGSEGPVERPPEFVEAVTDKSRSESPVDLKPDNPKPDAEAPEPRPSVVVVDEQDRVEADDESDDDEDFKDVFEVPVARFRSHKKHSVCSTDSDRRKRSLTTTDINLEVLEARDTLGELYSNVSKDDNYDTEFGKRHHVRAQNLAAVASAVVGGGLVSSFSAQDFAEILGPSLPTLLVEGAEREAEEEGDVPGEPGEMERSGSTAVGSVNGLNDADCSSAGDEGEASTGKLTPSSPASRTTSPDVVEPVVIPDSITPNMVSGVTLCV